MKRLSWRVVFVLLLLTAQSAAQSAAQPARAAEPPDALGIALETYAYPFPVQFMPLDWETAPGVREPVRMAYMDVPPAMAPADKMQAPPVALLLHGRNFPAAYWDSTIRALSAAGWRVIAPDAIGFGKSSKPVGDWSFDQAASATEALLEKLGVHRVDLIGHSMGGMLAMRLARTYPDRVHRLVLESPLGLEDYRQYVPLVPRDALFHQELGLTPEAYRFFMTSTYAPEDTAIIEPYVSLRQRLMGSAEYPRWVQCYDSSFYAIWGQPVLPEIKLIAAPTLFLVGTRDRTAPGKAYAKPQDRARMGHIAELAQSVAPQMPDAHVMAFEAGHLLHLEQPVAFNRAVIGFLGH